ncbi:(2Fe-2S)-binding protein [Kitasatospora sp. MAP12-15]|uniref:(2Fe-2S)-binding protein n=1 Tax=unclassified Kitasatospora TaxID=2633591 RepID=UPI003D1C27AE
MNEIAALGPFFAFEVHEGDGPARAPWREMAELVDDPAVLAGRAADVRGHLAGGRPVESVELRVAASVMHLGLTARLASPALAVATRYGAVLPLDLREARWQPVPGGMFPLSLPRRTLVPVADPAELAAALGVELLDGPCRAMVEATLPLCPSPQILWGNVASAVHGAAVALANSRPQLAGRARLLAGLVLAQPQLRDTCTGVGDGGPFRRRSCCLIYRAAPGGAGALCGDCVLRRG